MSQPQPATRRLVTQQQAARYVQKTDRTIRRWIGEGYITGYRSGPRTILVDLNEIERMFRVMPTSKMRDGRRPYGPKAKIVNVVRPEVVQPESGQ